MKYRPEIDGLRAVAVIPVILFHLDIGWIEGGFVGVDVFFVISGFLITSIIARELDTNTFTLKDFWGRRVRRILPAMIVVTAITLLATFFFVYRPDQQAIGQQAVASLLSIANFYFWMNAGDYWGTAAESSPLLHTWSLSVEEQFYLIFPVVLVALHKLRRSWIKPALLIVVLLSFMSFVAGIALYPDGTFYLLPMRAWELAIGGWLAISMEKGFPKAGPRSLLGLCGLLLITSSYLLITKLSALMVMPILGTLLVLAFAQRGWCNSILSSRPLVHLGVLSYSLYLWHWPIITLAGPIGLDWPGKTDKIVILILTYACSLATYAMVERPLRRRKGVIIPTVASLAVVVVAASVMALVPRSYDLGELRRGQFFNNRYSIHPDHMGVEQSGPLGIAFDIPNRDTNADLISDGGIVSLRSTKSPEVVLVGDSIALQWAKLVDDLGEQHNFSTAIFAMESWVPLSSSNADDNSRGTDTWNQVADQTLLSKLAQWRPRVIVVGQRWIRWSSSIEQYGKMLDTLCALGTHVLVLEQPPEPQMPSGRSAPLNAIYQGIRPERNRKVGIPARQVMFNDIPRVVVQDAAGASLVHIEDLYRIGNDVLIFDGLDPVYFDRAHLSYHGSTIARSTIESAILNALKD